MRITIIDDKASNETNTGINSMKKWLKLFVVMFLFIFSSCEKETFESIDLASFTVVNAVNAMPVKSDFTGKPGIFTSTETQTDFGGYTKFVAPANKAVPITIVSSIDSNAVVFARTFNFSPGDNYSLFLAGEPGSVDTILVKENMPVYTDTTMALRIINCSPSGPLKIVPVQVDYLGVAISQSPINSLGYKEKTEFISYPATASTGYYIIELRNPVTDDLLSSVYVSGTSPNNITVVIRGYIGGDPELGAIQVYHKY